MLPSLSLPLVSFELYHFLQILLRRLQLMCGISRGHLVPGRINFSPATTMCTIYYYDTNKHDCEVVPITHYVTPILNRKGQWKSFNI